MAISASAVLCLCFNSSIHQQEGPVVEPEAGIQAGETDGDTAGDTAGDTDGDTALGERLLIGRWPEAAVSGN